MAKWPAVAMTEVEDARLPFVAFEREVGGVVGVGDSQCYCLRRDSNRGLNMYLTQNLGLVIRAYHSILGSLSAVKVKITKSKSRARNSQNRA
jgi:hypothetical protein